MPRGMNFPLIFFNKSNLYKHPYDLKNVFSYVQELKLFQISVFPLNFLLYFLNQYIFLFLLVVTVNE